MIPNLNPVELQKWCDEHPDYGNYKKELEASRRAVAEEMGISYEELLKQLSTGDYVR